MATEPVADVRCGPAESLDEWASEPWTEGELDATGGHNSPLPSKEAPRAEPEEDIEKVEFPGETLHENLTVSTVKMADVPKMDIEEPRGVSQGAPRETQQTETELEHAPKEQSEGLRAHKHSEKSLSLVEDTLPTPSPLSGSPTEEGGETEGFCSLEGETAECISNVEVTSGPTEDLTSSDSLNSEAWPQTPHLVEATDEAVESVAEEITGNNLKTEEGVAQFSLAQCLDNSESGHGISGVSAETNPPSIHPASDRDSSEEAFTRDLPPFADEGEEEEEVSVDAKPLDISSARQQWIRRDSGSKPPQPSYSRNTSFSCEDNPASTQHAVPSHTQQGEQLLQGQSEYTPRGANQEAAQQVHSQSIPPLSTVAREPANQGAAGSRGCGSVVVLGEENRRAEERREGESRQTGKRGKKGEAVVVKHMGKVFKYSKVFRKQERKIGIYRSSSSCEHNRGSRMESDSCDDSQSDSGVSADFSPCSTLENHTTDSPAPPAKETPIEKEIRRAVEREQSLRKSRGLQNPPATPEYVDIPFRKSILSQGLPVKSERSQGKDRQFAGKKMQKEIHTEAQREQALVNLGKVPGFYDKGSVRELKEKKQLFEAFQEPRDSSLILSPRSKAPSWTSASDLSTPPANLKDVSSPASTQRGSFAERSRSIDLLNQTQSTTSPSAKEGGYTCKSPQGPGFSEGSDCQVIILEGNLSLPAQRLNPSKPLQHSHRSDSLTKAEALTVVNSGTLNASSAGRRDYQGETGRQEEVEAEVEAEVNGNDEVPAENPFFKLRSSTALVVEQDIREAQERERELRKQRSSLYRAAEVSRGEDGGIGGWGGGGRPARIERQRSTFSPLPNGLATPDLPASQSRGGAGSSTVRQSLGKLGMWPPAQTEDKQLNRSEAQLSPRAPRHKTPLLQRWESGLFNGPGEEDD
ncbi:uncharacterized protein misp3 isoform 1-T2 [Polymixia lowei]